MEQNEKHITKSFTKEHKIQYFSRKGTNCDLKSLEKIGINPILIENLHTKLYISEKSAIITSQNMVKSSDDYSIDFAHKIEKKEEIEQLKSYVKNHLIFNQQKRLILAEKVRSFDYDQYVNPLNFNQLIEVKKILDSKYPDLSYFENKNHFFCDSLIPRTDINISKNLSFKIYHDGDSVETSKYSKFEFPNLTNHYKGIYKDSSDYFYLIYEPIKNQFNKGVIYDYFIILDEFIKYRKLKPPHI